MNRFHFLSEAELDVKKNELLSQLSDEDLAMIVGELDEAEGGRFAFDPLKRQPAAQRQPVQQQPKPASKPQVQSKPQTKQEPKTQPKKVEPARKAEIKQTVDQLKPKEKTALVKAAKAELKALQRQEASVAGRQRQERQPRVFAGGRRGSSSGRLQERRQGRQVRRGRPGGPNAGGPNAGRNAGGPAAGWPEGPNAGCNAGG